MPKYLKWLIFSSNLLRVFSCRKKISYIKSISNDTILKKKNPLILENLKKVFEVKNEVNNLFEDFKDDKKEPYIDSDNEYYKNDIEESNS